MNGGGCLNHDPGFEKSCRGELLASRAPGREAPAPPPARSRHGVCQKQPRPYVVRRPRVVSQLHDRAQEGLLLDVVGLAATGEGEEAGLASVSTGSMAVMVELLDRGRGYPLRSNLAYPQGVARMPRRRVAPRTRNRRGRWAERQPLLMKRRAVSSVEGSLVVFPAPAPGGADAHPLAVCPDPCTAAAALTVGPSAPVVNVATLTACVVLATLEGALVALPRAAALERLGRLRSPAWALVAPGSLIVGTFGVLALPPLAGGLAALAALTTPVLAAIAVVAVVRGRHRALLLVPLALGVVAAVGTGWPAQLAASMLTALACLVLGAALVRLTPAPWLYLGVLSMGAVDVLLLALGVGQPAAALLGDAMESTILPAFHRAELGHVSKDYPDLVLAAVLGGIVAGRPIQQRVAALVAMLAAAYGGLFAVVDILPATVPIVLVLILVERSRFAPPAPWAARAEPARA